MVARTKRWSLDRRDGTLTATTGVTGRAARLGHRLTVAFPSWRIDVTFNESQPTAVALRVAVSELQIVGGEGGATPLTGPERAIARTNALTTLAFEEHPEIVFDAAEIAAIDDGYQLAGTLHINGVARPRRVSVSLGEDGPRTTFAVSTTVRHSDHGLKPYSLMMGSLKVADEVLVDFFAAAKPPVLS